MRNADSVEEELQSRLARYPAERYPIQHATARFHLGVSKTNTGDLDAATASLLVAVDLFDSETLPVEHAKSLNALGAALRLKGELAEAAEKFERAGVHFDRAGLPLEKGAAIFNLGLVARDRGNLDAAAEWFREAARLLEEQRVPAQAAAAQRELGATLLTEGNIDQAVVTLEKARDLAERAQDWAGLGAAANALGLALLARDDAIAAMGAFETAVSANPLQIRPEAYAMSKANLALANERAGRKPRSRLAARQALRVPAPDPVHQQAAGVLERLGDPVGDLLRVLADADEERWPGIMREELVWWAEGPATRVRAEAESWIGGLTQRRTDALELAEAWLGAILELTPDQMDRVISITLESLASGDNETGERFRSVVSAAMPRFHSPQFLRMKDTFSRIASGLGLKGWS